MSDQAPTGSASTKNNAQTYNNEDDKYADYDDFPVNQGASGGGGGSKTDKRHAQRGGGSNNIYSAKHVRAAEAQKANRK